jgi:hypothetical protein
MNAIGNTPLIKLEKFSEPSKEQGLSEKGKK